MNHDDSRHVARLIEPHRNNYFYGKLLDVGHLEMEQRYFNRKRWLLNRLALGSGVLCGLQVAWTDGKLTVAPGVAVDGLGREIVVPGWIELDPRKVVGADGVERERKPGESLTVYVCLEYRECLADFQPALVGECGPEPRGIPGTIVESFTVHLQVEKPAVSEIAGKLCEALRKRAEPGNKRIDLCEAMAGLDCSPPADPCVVLAAVDLSGTDAADLAVSVHNCTGRSVLYSNQRLFDLLLCAAASNSGSTTSPPAAAELTRIAKTSWTHDGQVTLGDFPRALTVTFSKAGVRPTTKQGAAWFIVTLEFPTEVPVDTGAAAAVPPPAATVTGSVSIDGTVDVLDDRATFTVSPAFVDMVGAGGAVPAGVLCRVTVKCDFLLDANELAVDGNHLGGKLPTGDGVAGGTFESWFLVTT